MADIKYLDKTGLTTVKSILDGLFATKGHDHDTVYSKLGHNHNDIYYTESEINTKLAGKSNTGHNHTELSIESVSDPNLAYSDQKLKYYLIGSTNSGAPGYAGKNYGFPVVHNANSILWLGNHVGNYGGQLGISGNGYLYYRCITSGSFPTNADGASWQRLAYISDFTGYATQNWVTGLGYTTATGHNHDSAYAPKSHGHDYLPLTGGMLTGNLTFDNNRSIRWHQSDSYSITCPTGGDGAYLLLGAHNGTTIKKRLSVYKTADSLPNTSYNLYTDGSLYASSASFGAINMGSSDINFKGADPGDIVWLDANNAETGRIYSNNGILSIRHNAGATYKILHGGDSVGIFSSTQHSNYNTSQDKLVTLSFMSYWNGAYNSSGSSNLTYCANGTIIGSNNIGSQSVNYANTAGTAGSAKTLSGGSIATWGTLTSGNGYTNVCTWDTGNTTGAFSLAGKGGQMSLQLDGYFYQNEGANRVTDVTETVTALGTNGNYLTWTKNGSVNNITVPYAASAGSAVDQTARNSADAKLPLTGGTMTGTPYINMPASAATIADNQPFGITYGRIQSYGTMTIAADTDASTTEFVNITAGYGVTNATAANGLSIGYNTLKWKGSSIINESHVSPANGSICRLCSWPGYGTGSVLRTKGFINADYGSTSFGHPDDEYLKAICKWAIDTYTNLADITLIGSCTPNSSGTCILHLYSSSGKDSTTKLPRYCAGIYQNLSGVLYRFGTVDYVWYYGPINTWPSLSDLGGAAASHGNHVPTTQTASNKIFLRNDNTWATVTPANIGALALTGGTLTGSVTFANGTWNVVGDDAAIGDYNVAGSLGLKSVNNNIPSIGFHNSSNTLLGTLKCDAGTLKWNANTIIDSGNIGSQSVNYATSAGSASIAGSATSTRYIASPDTRNIQYNINEMVASSSGVCFDFKQKSISGLAAAYSGIMTYRPYASASDWTGGPAHQLAFDENGLHWRIYNGSGFSNWSTVSFNGHGTHVSSGAQTWAGVKTFSSAPVFSAGFSSNSNATISGSVTASAGFFDNSDERLKDFYDNIDVDFNKLKSIPKKYFSWKADENKEIRLGTSAQAVKEVYPEIINDNEGTLTVDYSKLSVVALAAVDKLYDENQELKSKISSMEERLAKLEKLLGA